MFRTLVIVVLMTATLIGQVPQAGQGSSIAPAPGVCRTVVLPEDPVCANTSGGNCGAAVRIPPGGFRPVEYHPPAGVKSVGLEFWFHQFPGDAPAGSQYLMTYLNEPWRWSRRIMHQSNHDPSEQGFPKFFAMSTFLHPQNGEWLTVGWLNNTDREYWGYFALTLRECY